ncbi:uncharacterized protein LOC135717509 [Ochlerotatus camptorhynchus]|uniref:uncharacterized protein LOC135717509 n=1 Tax=Ochlerotatus camptorhynchus TaxID=644619 RepID=UPI0031D0C796
MAQRVGTVRRKVECRRMSDMETIRLVKLYRANQCLWNHSHVHYKLKNRRIEAYENLMVEMDMESVDEVKRKLKSIRDTYTGEKHKMLKSNYSYKTKLVWYPILDEFISKCDSGQPVSKASSPEVSMESPIVSRRKRKYKSDERFQPTLRMPRQDLSDPLQQHDVTDEFHYFGLSIASQLRSMARLDALILQDSLQRIMSAKRIEIARRDLTAESSATSEADDIMIEIPQTFSEYSLLPDSSINYRGNDEAE